VLTRQLGWLPWPRLRCAPPLPRLSRLWPSLSAPAAGPPHCSKPHRLVSAELRQHVLNVRAIHIRCRSADDAVALGYSETVRRRAMVPQLLVLVLLRTNLVSSLTTVLSLSLSASTSISRISLLDAAASAALRASSSCTHHAVTPSLPSSTRQKSAMKASNLGFQKNKQPSEIIL
jgi:hypothetical protein